MHKNIAYGENKIIILTMYLLSELWKQISFTGLSDKILDTIKIGLIPNLCVTINIQNIGRCMGVHPKLICKNSIPWWLITETSTNS